MLHLMVEQSSVLRLSIHSTGSSVVIYIHNEKVDAENIFNFQVLGSSPFRS